GILPAAASADPDAAVRASGAGAATIRCADQALARPALQGFVVARRKGSPQRASQEHGLTGNGPTVRPCEFPRDRSADICLLFLISDVAIICMSHFGHAGRHDVLAMVAGIDRM